MNFKGQMAIETLLILAVGLLMLGVLSAIVFNDLSIQFSVQQQRIGADTVRTLAKEIDDVYFLGTGSRKEVMVVIPQGTNFDKSYIQGKSLILNVNDNDFIASTNVEIRGGWPDSFGLYLFTLTSYGDFVSVSVDLLSFNPGQISETLMQGQESQKNLVVASMIDATQTYNFSIINNDSNVSVTSTKEGTVNVSSDGNNFDLNFSCGLNAKGEYPIILNFDGDTNVTFPVNLVCISSQTKLTFNPNSKNVVLASSQTSSEVFSLCNTASTDLFILKTEIIDSLKNYAFTSFSGTILSGECQDINVNFIAPPVLIDQSVTGKLKATTAGLTVLVDLNLTVLAPAVSDSFLNYFASVKNNDLNNNFNTSQNVKLTDNGWIATGELDWNKEAVNTTTSGGWGELVNDFNIATNNLVGVWHLGEASGNALDGSWVGNDATITNATYGVEGLWGTDGYYFNDGGAAVVVPSQTSINFGTGNFSMFAWVNPQEQTTGAGGKRIFGRNGYTFEFALGNVTNGLAVYDGTWRYSNRNIDLNKWTHVGIVRVGTTYTIYINGVGSTLAGGSRSVSGDLIIGSDYLYVGSFTGKIDEPAMWNTNLTSDEVKTLYEAQKGQWLDENLIAYYKFNGNVNDSARGHDGTLFVTANTNAQGMWDSNALECTDDGYVEIANNDVFDFDATNNKFTLMTWFKFDSYVDYGALISSRRGSYSWQLRPVGTKLNFLPSSGGAFNNNSDIALNKWYHVALVYDAGTATFYLNGIEDGSESGKSMTDYGNPIDICSSRATTKYYMDGQIDEVKIYDRALTAPEILADYNNFLNAKFVDNNIVDAGARSDWNSIKINLDLNYSFGHQIESTDTKYFDENLIGLWHLNNNALDSSGNVNDGTFNGTYSSGLWDSNAGEFNGTSNKITKSSPVNFDYSTGGPLTYSAWIKTTSTSTWGYLFQLHQTANNWVWGIRLHGTGTINFRNNNSSSWMSFPYLDSNGSVNDGKWHHVVVVTEDIDDAIRIYIDGVLDNSDESPGEMMNFTPDNLFIGLRGDSSSDYFQGNMEDIAIFDKALTDNDVRDLYRKGVASLDLNVYSCSDANCNTKISSQLINDANNNSWMDLTVSDSRYLGWEAIFGKATGLEDLNAESFFVNAYVKDVNISYSS